MNGCSFNRLAFIIESPDSHTAQLDLKNETCVKIDEHLDATPYSVLMTNKVFGDFKCMSCQ